ncbi:hypothetical protein [Cellulomonas aerilata]|uniref:Uncharacterized protein n=1 Tax=Cellulomonas aerilata TaxID=515326 RepID=A0A512DCX9_9CELL|nr:hypothetical protein [Cellulomonas aerilata]GEO34070.1 hypothetical protein CAE01nite_17950 [Cellulomonas aerilata]
MRSFRTRSTPAVAAAVGLAVLTSATAVYAVGLQPDGTHLRAQWTTGGQAWLELEDRNVEPSICFIWDHPAPQDGDSFSSRILTRTGTEVVDLGTADQWVDGAGEGCEIPRDDRYRDVFANPGNYVVEFEVVENQGTAPTAPVRSGPLQPATT